MTLAIVALGGDWQVQAELKFDPLTEELCAENTPRLVLLRTFRWHKYCPWHWWDWDLPAAGSWNLISFWLTNVQERREESLKPLRLEMVGGSDPKALQVVDGLSLDLAISPFVLASDAIARYHDCIVYCQISWWLSMAIHQIRPFNCLNYSQATFYPFDVVITSLHHQVCKLKIIRVTMETIVKRRVANCAHPTQCNGLRTLWKSGKIVKLLCALLRLCEHCPLCAGPIMPCQNNYLCSVPSTSSPPVSIVPPLDGNRQASTKKARYILLHTFLWNYQESLVCIAWTQYSCDVWFAYMQGWSISEENSYSVSSSSIRSINLLYCLYMDLPARFLWLSLLIFSKGVNDIISCEEDISLFGYFSNKDSFWIINCFTKQPWSILYCGKCCQ